MFHVDGVVIDVNQRLCEMIGYTREEMLGPRHACAACVAPEDLPARRSRASPSAYEGDYVITGDPQGRLALPRRAAGQAGPRSATAPCASPPSATSPSASARTRCCARASRASAISPHGAFDFTVFSRDGVIVDVDGDTERHARPSRARRCSGARSSTSWRRRRMPTCAADGRANRLGSIRGRGGPRRTASWCPTHARSSRRRSTASPCAPPGVRDLRPARRLEAERRALEQQVERAQRLDSLGVLAGGIAHDFNNLLAGVLGNAELLRETRDDRRGRARPRAAIVAAAQRAAALTRQMLAYAGQRDLGRREPVDVGELRARAAHAAGRDALEEGASSSSPIDAGQRRARRPRHARPGAHEPAHQRVGRARRRARRIRVRARPRAARSTRAGTRRRARPCGPGDWVLIEVARHGRRAWTKRRAAACSSRSSRPRRRGHGLGLAACLGIVSAHGGAVLVESELGRGSCFSVLLPASEPASARPSAAPPRRREPRRARSSSSTTRPLVRTQLRRSLELRGYSRRRGDRRARRARGAGDGVAPRSAPDVVILDMTMPDIDGAEVLRAPARLRLARPGRRVVGLPRRLGRAPAPARRVPGLPAPSPTARRTS